MKEQPEYCCIWCHTALKPEETYVAKDNSTVCKGCRGLGVVLNKWNKPCKRCHTAASEEVNG